MIRTFKIASQRMSEDRKACVCEINSYAFHNGNEMLPKINDTLFIDIRGEQALQTNGLWVKIEGESIVKTDDNGVITQIMHV